MQTGDPSRVPAGRGPVPEGSSPSGPGAGFLSQSELRARRQGMALLWASVLPYTTFLFHYLGQEPHYLCLIDGDGWVLAAGGQGEACRWAEEQGWRVGCRCLSQPVEVVATGLEAVPAQADRPRTPAVAGLGRLAAWAIPLPSAAGGEQTISADARLVVVAPADRLGALQPLLGAVAHAIRQDISLRSRLHQLAGDAGEAESLRAELRRLEHLRSLGELTPAIVHELRNPLTAIRGLAQLARHLVSGGQPERAREAMCRIERAVDRLNAFLSQMLVLARPTQPQLAAVTVSELLDSLLPLVQAEAEAAGIQVEVSTAANLPPLWADVNWLSQAMLNVARNGLQAMGSGGTLRLAAGPAPEPGWVLVSIEDTGPGIPLEVQSRMFQAFVTTKPGGTGLGLPITRHIICDMHGGRLWYRTSSRGTTFYFCLRTAPAADTPQPPGAEAAASGSDSWVAGADSPAVAAAEETGDAQANVVTGLDGIALLSCAAGTLTQHQGEVAMLAGVQQRRAS